MTRAVVFHATTAAVRDLAALLGRLALPPGIAIHTEAPLAPDATVVGVLRALGLDADDLLPALIDDAARLQRTPATSLTHIHLGRGGADSDGAIAWPLPDATSSTGSWLARVGEALWFHLEALAAATPQEPALGVLGGSGLYDLPGLTDRRTFVVATAHGQPSSPLVEGRLGGARVVFLARHGEGHRLLPGEINARANIAALKAAGVTRVVSVSAVGSLREEIAPGDVVIPHQFIDRTSGRPATFFGRGAVAHVSLGDPVCRGLASRVGRAAGREGVGADHGPALHEGGTYVCIEGPQFSTRAESRMHRAFGADVVGMTNLPEARLAREAELCYVSMTLPTDYDAWRPHDDVVVKDVMKVLKENTARAARILAQLVLDEPLEHCGCQRALDDGLLTPASALPLSRRVQLHGVAGPVLRRRAVTS